MAAIEPSRAPGRALAWWLALRPWSFTISLAPVLAGTSLAMLDGYPPNLALAAVALLACVLIHGGTNLQNDVGDFRRGADLSVASGRRASRPRGGCRRRRCRRPLRYRSHSLSSPAPMVAAHGGWPIVAIGVVSVAAGAVYTAGPRPVAYSGWGEAFVIVFFGFVAVGGTYYLHARSVASSALLAGAALGALAAAVLVLNNLRDIDSDRRAGKHTLAVRLGPRFTVREYAVLIHIPFLLCALMRNSAAPCMASRAARAAALGDHARSARGARARGRGAQRRARRDGEAGPRFCVAFEPRGCWTRGFELHAGDDSSPRGRGRSRSAGSGSKAPSILRSSRSSARSRSSRESASCAARSAIRLTPPVAGTPELSAKSRLPLRRGRAASARSVASVAAKLAPQTLSWIRSGHRRWRKSPAASAIGSGCRARRCPSPAPRHSRAHGSWRVRIRPGRQSCRR